MEQVEQVATEAQLDAWQDRLPAVMRAGEIAGLHTEHFWVDADGQRRPSRMAAAVAATRPPDPRQPDRVTDAERLVTTRAAADPEAVIAAAGHELLVALAQLLDRRPDLHTAEVIHGCPTRQQRLGLRSVERRHLHAPAITTRQL